MFEKGNRYLADWRDKKGRRRRKSFATPAEAQFYEDAQKASAHPKTRRVGRPSPSPSRNSRAKPAPRQGDKRPNSSSVSAKKAKSSHSTLPIQPSSTKGSQNIKAPSRATSAHRQSANCSVTSSSTTERTKNSSKQSRPTNSQSREISRQPKKKGLSC